MITYVANIFNLLASVLQNFIFITSAIGQVIVITVRSISSLILNCVASVLEFFQIVYEDNIAIFTEDLPNFSSEIIEALCQQWFYFHDIMLNLCNETTLKFNLFINNIKWSFLTVFFVFGEVLSTLKTTVIFLGDTLWLVLTFVPIHLPYLVKTFYKELRDSLMNYAVNTYKTLLEVIIFLTDVPLESVTGLITAIVLIRSIILFREIILLQINEIYWILIRKVMYLYYAIYHYFTNSEVRLITQLVGGHVVSGNMDIHLSSDNDDNVNAADALCVICQEHQKCVLTLPCRHVCLCSDCCIRLYDYQRTCPICRTFIYHSVNIYL